MTSRTPIMLIPGFTRFLLALCCSQTAFQMTATAVGWQMYTTTGHASDLGLIGLAQFLPVLALTLSSGHMADRYDRRLLVVIAQGVACAAAFGTALASHAGIADKWALLALVQICAIASVIQGPSFVSMTPGLVPAAALPNAVAASYIAQAVAVVVGPALGGLLYMAGPATVYAASTIMFASAGVMVAQLHYVGPLPKRVQQAADIFDGVRFIRSRPDILAVLSLDLFAVLLGGATALLPVFAKDILHTGAWGLGMLRMSPAVGELVVAAWLARRPIEKNAGMLLFGSVAGFGVTTIAFAFSCHLWISLVSLAVLGGFDMVSMVIRGALVQIDTPDEMRGRVSAVNSIFIGTSNQLGAFESGMAAAFLGAVPAVLVGGVGTVFVVAAWMWMFPTLRRRQALRTKDALN